MGKRLKKFGWRTSHMGLEILAAVVCALLFAAGLFVWRLSTGPFDISFARKYIQEALHDPSTGTDVSLSHVSLSWPKLNKPLQLTLQDIALERGGKRILSIDNAVLGLSAAPLLIGRIEPVVISLARPTVGMVRTPENHFEFAFAGDHTEAGKPDAESGNVLQGIIASLSRPPERTKGLHSPLAGLKTIKIEDATVILEDHYANLTWYLQHMNFEFGRDAKGLAVSASVKVPGGLHGESGLQLDAIYDRNDGSMSFNLHIEDFNLAAGAGKLRQLDFLRGQKVIVTGDLSGRLDDTMKLQAMSLQLTGEQGLLALRGVYDDLLPFSGLDIAAHYDAADQKITVERIKTSVKGVTLEGAASIAVAPGAVKASVRVKIPKVAQSQIGPLWPDILKGDGAEAWLVHKLSDGAFSNIMAQFDVATQRLSEEDDWKVTVENIAASFDAADMTVDYRAPMIPVTGASGRGVYQDGNLDIDITKGAVGALKVGKSHVKLKNIAHARQGEAIIDVAASGPLQTVFDYIAKEPINMNSAELGFDTKGVKGSADLKVNVRFPTIKHLLTEQVMVAVDSTLTGILLPGVVENMNLSGGPFKLQVKDAAASLSGKGKFDGRDIDVVWHQYLDSAGKPYSSRVTAKLAADESLRKKFRLDLEDWITGTLPVDIVYTVQRDKSATVDVKADATPGTLTVKPFDYTKPPGTPGEIGCTVALQSGRVQGIGKLHVKTPELTIENGELTFGQRDGKNALTGGRLPVAKLHETDVALNFEMGEKKQIRLEAKGAFLDASPFLGKRNKPEVEDKEPAPPLIAAVQVDRMRTGPERTIDKVRLSLDRSASGILNRLELDAVAGKGMVYFSLKPDASGRLGLQARANDAGALLKAFDIYKNAEGGTLTVDGQAPDGSNKTLIRGKAQLSNFKVVNAPVLARLLNAMSIASLPGLLNGQGLGFTQLEANFEWGLRPVGDIYKFTDGRTSGASLGLTFEGTIDKQKSWTNINGTIVPVSGINDLVGNIPVLGTILTGGGALFAFTYSIEGPSEKPGISVNPLSALAPGIIRKMFFEGG